MAPWLLYWRDIKFIGGANHAINAFDAFQKDAGENDQTARHVVQTMRRTDLLFELPESASRGAR